MALIDSKQLNPKFTGSFTLSGSSQTLVGAKVEFTNANAKISGSATSTGSFGQVEAQGFGTTAKTLISGSTNALTVGGSWRGELSSSALTFVGGGVSGSASSTGSFGRVKVAGSVDRNGVV